MKNARQKQILNFIENYEVETQEELCDRLRSAGYHVTQATVSRDIRELKLTKIVGEGGKQKYAMLSAGKSEDDSRRHLRVFQDAVKTVDTAGNLLVIKTNSGMAPAVGAAIDSMGIPEVVGCIAGDDTIMCAMKNPEDSAAIMEKIGLMLSSSRSNPEKSGKRENIE